MPPIIKTLRAALFEPSGSLGGSNSPTVFRGENFVLRGMNTDSPYFEVYGGNKDLGENYNLNTANYKLTGTLSFNAGSNVVNGAGTAFLSQLHIGQLILSGTEVFAVKEITGNASFVAYRAPQTAASGQTGFRLPQLFEIEGKRGVLLTGNAIQTERGNLIAVGSGELYINGLPLAGNSLVAASRPQAAVYRAGTNDYVIRQLGFDNPPPQPTINIISGGTKGMVIDNLHSFMISYWSPGEEGTDGYSNPCEVVKLNGAAAPIKITALDSRFEFDFTASLVGIPANAGGFIIWGNLAGKKSVSIQGSTTTTTSPNQTNYENGPWYRVKKIKLSDLDGSNKFAFDYLDSDVFEEVTGNNDAPPDCEFVAKIEGKPMYISAYGRTRVGGDVKGSNPGPNVLVSKFANPDGAPSEWAASVSRDIIGWFEGVGRWFLMTPSSLDFVFSTGLFGASQQGGNQLEIPVATRPYWRTGAANRYSIIIVDDTLFGFSGNKMFQSVGSGDENVKKYEFGAKVEDITRKWNAGHVYTVHDAKNNQVCAVYSAAFKNAAGFWCSLILPFSLFGNAWLPAIVLSSETGDRIVSGVATIGERFEFLCGGRVAGGSFQMRTYRFDGYDEGETVPAVPTPYYLIWQPSDDGLKDNSKVVHGFAPMGKFTNLKIQVHGARPGGTLKVEDMEKGINYLGSEIAVEDSDDVTVYLQHRTHIKNLSNYAVRLSGVWDGVGIKDRLEELEISVGVHGRKR